MQELDAQAHLRLRTTFFCKICVPVSIDTNVSKDTENEKMEKTSSGWKCKICNLCVKTSYSKKRHITNQHIGDSTVDPKSNSTPEAKLQKRKRRQQQILTSLNRKSFLLLLVVSRLLMTSSKKRIWKNIFPCLKEKMWIWRCCCK